MKMSLIKFFLVISFPLCAMQTALDKVVADKDLVGLNRLISFYGKALDSERKYFFADMVNAQDNDGMTAMHRILHGTVDSTMRQIIHLLLENGARIDILDRHGYTPLHVAATWEHEDIISTILDVNPRAIDLQNNDGIAALHNASLCGHEAIVKLLISRGANKDIRDRNGTTPLHVAACYGKIAAVKVLLEAGALVSQDSHGRTPLHYAAQNGRKVIVRMLASRYPHSLNIPDATGATPLHLAVKMIRYPDVKILLKAGADVLARDREGRTPFHYAVKSQNKKMLKLFKGKVTECINCRDNAGLTPYEFACSGVQEESVCAELRVILDDLIRS